LLQDLGHILSASRVGARLNYDAMPVAASLQGVSPAARMQAVLGGGDVYELCFTAAAQDHERVLSAAARAGVPVSRVGQITQAPELVVLDADGQPLSALPRGFDHFPGS